MHGVIQYRHLRDGPFRSPSDWAGNSSRGVSIICLRAGIVPIKEKRAHTPLANRILGNVKLASKPHGFATIQDINQRPLLDPAEWTMKETRPQGPVRLDHC